MHGIRSPEVLVVGAGPVGMLTALALAERGVGVDVLDMEPRTAARSHALAIHPRTLGLLDELGLADALIEKGWRVDALRVFEGTSPRARFDLGDLTSRFPFALVLPQNELEDSLQDRLRAHGVEIKWNHRVTRLQESDSTVDLTIERLDEAPAEFAVTPSDRRVVDRSTIESRFVVGADGHRSFVRRALRIEFDERGKPELYAVVEFETEEGPGHEMRVILNDAVDSALWPLGEHRCRWSFELQQSEALDSRVKSRTAVRYRDETLPHVERDQLLELVEARAPWHRPEVTNVDWCTIVQFEKRLARKFGHGNVWLAGDAAHLARPIGVQSMNLGLLEGVELASRMADILREKASATLLEAYGRERLLDWHMMFSGEEAITATDEADEWVARHRGRLLDCLPASGDELTALLGQAGLERL